MFWIKKIIILGGVLLLVYGGSTGTQSSSLFIQGMSFVGLLVILIILYVFAKMLIRGLGCMPSFLIMTGVGLFMMYALGMFNQGVGGVVASVYKFIGVDMPETEQSQNITVPVTKSAPIAPEVIESEESVEPAQSGEDEVLSLTESSGPELFDDYKAKAEKALENEIPKNEPKQGLIEQVVSAISVQKKNTEQRPFNPNDYPLIYTSARVLTGDMLEIHGKYFKLFGIAAPEISQTCANARGQSYNCGREAAIWLKGWIQDGELECHIIQQDTRGNMVGTCSYGPYDLGAALVNAGWAVAYTKYTTAYVPYELQAQQAKRGLWQGQFYKPWDWKKIQDRKNDVKVIKKKKRRIGLFG